MGIKMKINKNLTTVNYNKGSGTGRIKYIVIHYTANNGDTAWGNTNYFKSVNRNASAHYFVDENEVWQCVEDKDIAWHCGTTGKYYHSCCRNANSLGVELCSEKDSKGKSYFTKATVKLAAELVRWLMAKYDVSIENVIRHYDVTHKNCPAPFVENVMAWGNFKDMLITEGDDEMVCKTDFNCCGKNIEMDRILKDSRNYIYLRDLEKTGLFRVTYNEKTKTPGLEFLLKDIPIEIDGETKTVKGLNVNGTNIVGLRDFCNALGNVEIDYKDRPVIIRQ